MGKKTKKVNGLIDWNEEAKKFLLTTKYSHNIYCTIKKALDECGLERIDDGCLSIYKMDGVTIEFDPTWAYITLSANGLEDYEIPYQHPERIVSSFFIELREYWRRYAKVNRSS